MNRWNGWNLWNLQRSTTLVFLSILALAFAARVWRLGAGLPFWPSVDEPEIMDRVVRIMRTGDYNPHFFDWPNLVFYAQLVVACLAFLGGAMRGMWSHLNQIAPTDLYLTARLLTVVTGTATVAVLYAAARRWGRYEALLAAALLAVLPNHVRESHYVLTDIPAAFFTTLTFLLALRASERQTLAGFAWAGLGVGLAASSKYNGLVAIVMPVIAAFDRPADASTLARRLLVIAAAAAAGFLAGTPYAVLDLPAFLNRYARMASDFAGVRGGEPGWLLYLKHMRGALGWPALVMSAGGLAAALWHGVRGPARVRWLIPAVFALLYYKVMGGAFQIYGRYLLPLYPVLVLFCAVAAVQVVRTARERVRNAALARLAAATVLIVVVAPPAWGAWQFEAMLSRTSTSELAYNWIRDHVPPGSTIVIEGRTLLLPTPPFKSSNVRTLIGARFEDYLSKRVDYLVASTSVNGSVFANPSAHPSQYSAYQTLFTQATEVARFDESRENPGPTIRVFKVGSR